MKRGLEPFAGYEAEVLRADVWDGEGLVSRTQEGVDGLRARQVFGMGAAMLVAGTLAFCQTEGCTMV